MLFFTLNIMIFLVGFAGGLLPLFWNRLQQWMPHAIAFASGVLLGAAVLHILPESYEILGWPVFFVTAAGFALFYFPQKVILNNETESSYKKWGYLAFLGITIHSLTDGIGVGAIGPGDSIFHVAFAVAVHKFPATIALSLLLAAAGFERKHAVWMIFLFALSTPAGAYLTKNFLSGQNHSLQGYALAFSAGNFFAIILGDLTQKDPEKNRGGLIGRLPFFALGFLANMLHLH